MEFLYSLLPSWNVEEPQPKKLFTIPEAHWEWFTRGFGTQDLILDYRDPEILMTSIFNNAIYLGAEDVTEESYDDIRMRDQWEHIEEEETEEKIRDMKTRTYMVFRKDLGDDYFYNGRPPYILFSVKLYQHPLDEEKLLLMVTRYSGYGDRENHVRFVRKLFENCGLIEPSKKPDREKILDFVRKEEQQKMEAMNAEELEEYRQIKEEMRREMEERKERNIKLNKQYTDARREQGLVFC